MMYYTFQLDPGSQHVYVISIPYSLYKYNCLPMGIGQSSDIAQEVLETLFPSHDGVEICIVDICSFSFIFSSHVHRSDVILHFFKTKGIIINLFKREWDVQDTD